MAKSKYSIVYDQQRTFIKHMLSEVEEHGKSTTLSLPGLAEIGKREAAGYRGKLKFSMMCIPSNGVAHLVPVARLAIDCVAGGEFVGLRRSALVVAMDKECNLTISKVRIKAQACAA